MHHMVHVYEDDNHWYTHILYEYLNDLRIHQKTFSGLYIQFTVQDE